MPKKVLIYADFVEATTGFATVARNIAKNLHRAGWQVDQLAINNIHSDSVKIPYLNYYRGAASIATQSASKDPYGAALLPHALKGMRGTNNGFANDYDVLFFMQDLFIFEKVAEQLKQIKKEQPNLKIIYYIPVDGEFKANWLFNLDVVDELIPFSNYGKRQAIRDIHKYCDIIDQVVKLNIREEDKKARLKVKDNLLKVLPKFEQCEPIYHGTDVNIFKPLNETDAVTSRDRFFGKHSDKFIVLNVNRNQYRKDISRTIEIFAKYHAINPKSYLYMHMNAMDSFGSNLYEVTTAFNLKEGEDWGCMNTHGMDNVRLEPHDINLLYNIADCHLSTTLGEGWGLTTTEAMCAGTICIAPHNTTIPEILGDGRGEIVPIEPSMNMFNNNDFNRVRYRMDIDKGVEALRKVEGLSEEEWSNRVNNAMKWARSFSWVKQTKEFIKRF